ncbi:MAG: ATP-binding cassette domain-containing protein, partial [Actinomycetota bacterium]
FIRREDRRAAMGALERVGMAYLAGRRVGELSGGEHQRVMIARALVADASLLVLDEPGAGVDRAARHRLAELLGSLHREGTTIILAAHDMGVMGRHLTRAAVLHEGHLDDVVLEGARC